MTGGSEAPIVLLIATPATAYRDGYVTCLNTLEGVSYATCDSGRNCQMPIHAPQVQNQQNAINLVTCCHMRQTTPDCQQTVRSYCSGVHDNKMGTDSEQRVSVAICRSTGSVIYGLLRCVCSDQNLIYAVEQVVYMRTLVLQ